MNTNVAWRAYHQHGTIDSDNELLTMLQEVIDTIRALERIYLAKSSLVVSGMLSDYTRLLHMARARDLTDIPSL